MVGVTSTLTPVPIGVPPQLPEYQCQFAPVPNVPLPLKLSVTVLPGQALVEDELILSGAVDGSFVFSVILTQPVVLQVPSALT